MVVRPEFLYGVIVMAVILLMWFWYWLNKTGKELSPI